MKANSFSKSPIPDINNHNNSNISKKSSSNNKAKYNKNTYIKHIEDKKIATRTKNVNAIQLIENNMNNLKSAIPTPDLNLQPVNSYNPQDTQDPTIKIGINSIIQEKEIIRSNDSIENLNSDFMSVPEERVETENKYKSDEIRVEKESLVPDVANIQFTSIPVEEKPYLQPNTIEEENKEHDNIKEENMYKKKLNEYKTIQSSKADLNQPNLTVLSEQEEILNSNILDFNSKDDSKMKEDNENILSVNNRKIDSSNIQSKHESKPNHIHIEKNENKIYSNNNFNKLEDTKENDYSDILVKKKDNVNTISGITETKDMNTQLNDNITNINNNTNTVHQEHNVNQIINEDNYYQNNENYRIFEAQHNEMEDELREINDHQKEKLEIQFINFKNQDNSYEEEEINSANNGIREKCSKIFHNFAQFSSEDNSFFLSKQVLVKLLKITGLIEEKIIRYADLDLLIVKVCGTGKKLNLKQFNNFVIRLAEFIDPRNFKTNPRNTSINLINTLFDPFIEFIQKKYELNDNTTLQWNAYITETLESLIYNFEVSFHISSLLKDLYNSLKSIYCAYFESEINGINLLENSFNHYLIFCKDFEIFPYILNMNQIAIYWKIVNSTAVKIYKIFDDRKETGKLFTLNKFTMMILHFSLLGFNKLNENYYKNFSNQGKIIFNKEKLLFFLEKLQNSKGFNNYETRTNKRLRVSLIPKKETIKIILPTLSSMSFSEFIEDNKDSMPMSVVLSPKKIKEFNDSNKKNKSYDFKQILVSGDIIIEILNEKSEMLKEIFDRYSNIGDKFTMNKMNLTGFLSFLKDCNVILLNQNISNSNVSLNMFSTRSVSPIKSISNNFNMFSSNNNSSISLKKNLNKVQNNIIYGKLLESDATILFNNLTGNKNFDNSTSIKRQFDKNKGFSMNFNDSQKVSIISHNKSLSSTKVNSISKMDFNLFIKSFEVIAKKIYPDKDINEAIFIFLENDIGRLMMNKNEKQISEKNRVLEILQNIRNDEIINLIREFHDPIFFHYQNYSENEYMGFSNFLNFYKDFDLFPSIVSMVQIKAIFLELAELFSLHLKNNIKLLKSRNKEIENRAIYNPLSDIHTSNLYKKQDIINYDLFLDSIAISAYYMKYSDQYTHCEKILLLIEKMSKSKGILISQKRSGKTFNSFKELKTSINNVKNKYPEYVAKKNNQNNKEKNEADFSFIFQTRD